MNKLFFLSILSIFCSVIKAQDYNPFHSRESIVTDTFHNDYIIEDKYRWLEDTHTEESKEWVKRQNKLSKKYLSKTSSKTNSSKAIDEYAHVRFNFPIKKGKYYFKYMYPTKFSVPSLYYQNSFNSAPKLLIDSRKFSRKDNVTLKGYSVSKDSKLVAYQFNRNGSDWTEIKLISIKNRKYKKDHLTGIKFSNIAWRGDGFYYSTFNQQSQFGKTDNQKVYYHKIGTNQDDDKLIFKRKNKPNVRFHFKTTSDERFFILKEIDEQKNQTNIFYIDYHSKQTQLQPLIINTKGDANILENHEGKLIAITFKDSNNGMIVEIDPADPYNWKAIVPEYPDALLLKAIICPDRIVAVYQANQHSIITIFDYSGKVLHTWDLRAARSISKFIRSNLDDELYFYITSYTLPPIVYKLNIKTFIIEQTEATSTSFDNENIIYEEVEYMSKDNVAIPMILVYEKGIKHDGTNPTILKAYGGFGIISPLSYDPGIVHFIKKGGIFAFANIRGGGDKGKNWALSGKGIHKQNSFDDFISAAEFLIEKNYTNKDKLAITGGSNGGLVVAAAAAIQRPDLFKAVVPIVSPFDMLRFEQFTVGSWHVDEYGTIEDKSSFTNLKNYSPYHNIQEDVNYPTMLIVTSENDDRVPPFHSYKFVAQMQSRIAQKNPILLKVEKKSGHSGASTRISSNRAKADVYGFIMNEVMK